MDLKIEVRGQRTSVVYGVVEMAGERLYTSRDYPGDCRPYALADAEAAAARLAQHGAVVRMAGLLELAQYDRTRLTAEQESDFSRSAEYVRSHIGDAEQGI